MTDEELIETLWSGEVTLGVVASAADRIEQLVKDVNETHKEAMAWIEKWGAALKSQREAEAKLAKAIEGLMFYAERADYEYPSHSEDPIILDDKGNLARAVLAELDAAPSR